MAILSKFVNDVGSSLGVPALAISRGLYSAAIIAYIAKVAYPAITEHSALKKHDPPKDEEDEAIRRLSRQISQPLIKEKSKPRPPAVNRYVQYHV